MRTAATLCGIALFMLGILLGAAGTNTLIGKQVDHLSLINITLENQLADTRQELQKLKESSQKKQKQVITAIEIYLLLTSRDGLTDYDELSLKVEVDQKVKSWLAPLVGQEVARLDTLWIPSVVDNRELEVNGNKYRLKTTLIVINQQVEVYLKATLLKGENKQ